jgi:hypothetical protein
MVVKNNVYHAVNNSLLTVYNVYIRCNELRQQLSKLKKPLIFLAVLDPLQQKSSIRILINL